MVSITFTIFYYSTYLNNLISFLFAENYIPVEFVTLKDGSEGLLIFNDSNKKYKFLDPFHPSDAVDTTNNITDDITYDIITDIANDDDIKTPKNIIITKSNRKLYI